MVAATVTVVKTYDAAFVRRSGVWARFLLRQPFVRVRQAKPNDVWRRPFAAAEAQLSTAG
jgi:hypothetical protein